MTSPNGTGDEAILTELLTMERLTGAVLGQVLAARHLFTPRVRHLARRILAQERAHAAALSRHLPARPRRVSPRPGAAGLDAALAVRHVDRSVEDVHSEKDALDLLLDLEGMAEGAYYDALSKLARPELILLAGQLLAAEAQHESLLGVLRHPKNFDRATPYPYVEGIKP